MSLARSTVIGSARRLVSRRLPKARTFASSRSVNTSESSPYPPASIPSAPSERYLAQTHRVSDPSSSECPAYVRTALERSSNYLLPVYARPNIILSHGEGLWVWDNEGRKYLDFSAGIAVNALGHGDEAMLSVLTTEAKKLIHTSNVYHNEWAGKLAELLVTLTQREGGLGFPAGAHAPPSEQPGTDAAAPAGGSGAKVFFANTGAEANEGALKVARKVGKDRGGARKAGLVCFANAFHGRTMGALSVTANAKYQDPFAPLLPGVRVGELNDHAGLNALVDDATCAVIVEPIQGEGGCTAAEVDWLRALRKRCDETGAVLIYDEVQCGLYRSGTMWAHSALPTDCHPDIITMAKPLANGYPIGAVLMRDSVAQTMSAGTHGTTFGGSPLACALGHHVLTRLSARPFAAHVAESAAHLAARLERLPQYFPGLITGVRGRGLIRGLVFRDGALPAELVRLARERGVLLLTAGKDAVRFVPSLTVDPGQIDMTVDVVESCLTLLARGDAGKVGEKKQPSAP